MILGITGGTGCGKTTLLEAVRKQGGITLDCDAIYHELLETDVPMLCRLQKAFPDCFADGRLVRKRLGERVFSDPAALSLLNGITHAAVRQEVLRQLERKPALAAIDAIALLESGLGKLCDVTVAVVAPREERIRRLMARDGISRSYAERRIDAQHPESWFREHCDYVLENSGTAPEFFQKCDTFLKKIKEETT